MLRSTGRVFSQIPAAIRANATTNQVIQTQRRIPRGAAACAGATGGVSATEVN